jgi:cysteine-rich repeat protein
VTDTTADVDASDVDVDVVPDAGCTTSDQCAGGQICVDGDCVVVGCTPGTTACTTGAVLFCNAAGDWISQACADGTSCEISGGFAQCVASRCAESESGCVDAFTRYACDPTVGEIVEYDCAPGTTCVGGSCLPQACSPGVSRCADATLFTCDGVGRTETAIACGLSEACVGAELCECRVDECVGLACVPNSRVCDGNSAVLCSSDGLRESRTACPAGQTCSGGECLSACVPSTTRCNGATIESCNGSGVVVASTNCATTGQGCDPTPAPHCAAVCTPGSGRCASSTSIALCGADGYENAVTNCAAGQSCVAGACVAPICTPGDVICEDGSLKRCDPSGSEYVAYHDCGLFGCILNTCWDGSGGGTCGDGIIDSGEECDDGNTNPGDNCDAVCSVECVPTDVVVSSGAAATGDLAEYADDFSPPCGSDGPDAAFSFVAPTTRVYTFTHDSSVSGATLWIANGDCFGSSLGCDTYSGLFDSAPTLSIRLTAGQSVTIHLEAPAGDSMPFDLLVE